MIIIISKDVIFSKISSCLYFNEYERFLLSIVESMPMSLRNITWFICPHNTNLLCISKIWMTNVHICSSRNYDPVFLSVFYDFGVKVVSQELQQVFLLYILACLRVHNIHPMVVLIFLNTFVAYIFQEYL